MGERMIRTRNRQLIDINKPLLVQWPHDGSYLAFEEEAEDMVVAANVPVGPKGDIPIPGVRIVDTYEKDFAGIKPFHQPPNHYVDWLQVKDEMDLFLEYELDDQDEKFLQEEVQDPNVDELTLEILLDWLEKESFKRREYRQIKLTPDAPEKPVGDASDPSAPAEPEEDDPCSVCNDRDWDEDNKIVYCDGCGIAVHQECVNLKSIPTDEWFCDACKYLRDWDRDPVGTNQEYNRLMAQSASAAIAGTGSASNNRNFYSPKKSKMSAANEAAVKRSGKKSKLSSSSASVGGGKYEPAADDAVAINSPRVSDIPAYNPLRRPKISCMLCPDETGAFKPTTRPGKWIHIVCALYTPELCFLESGVVDVRRLDRGRAGLVCEVCDKAGGCVQCSVLKCMHCYHVTCARKNGQLIRIKSSKKNDVLKYETFCPHHSIVKRNEEIREAKEVKETPVQLGVFLDDYTWEEVEEKVLPALIGHDRHIPFETWVKITNYWKKKRQARQNGRRPFIYKLQVAVEEDKVEFDAGRFFETEKRRGGIMLQSSDYDKFVLMRQLRHGFERARILIDQIPRRENKKLKYLKTLRALLGAIARTMSPNGTAAALFEEDSEISVRSDFDVSFNEEQPLATSDAMDVSEPIPQGTVVIEPTTEQPNTNLFPAAAPFLDGMQTPQSAPRRGRKRKQPEEPTLQTPPAVSSFTPRLVFSQPRTQLADPQMKRRVAAAKQDNNIVLTASGNAIRLDEENETRVVPVSAVPRVARTLASPPRNDETEDVDIDGDEPDVDIDGDEDDGDYRPPPIEQTMSVQSQLQLPTLVNKSLSEYDESESEVDSENEVVLIDHQLPPAAKRRKLDQPVTPTPRKKTKKSRSQKKMEMLPDPAKLAAQPRGDDFMKPVTKTQVNLFHFFNRVLSNSK